MPFLFLSKNGFFSFRSMLAVRLSFFPGVRFIRGIYQSLPGRRPSAGSDDSFQILVVIIR